MFCPKKKKNQDIGSLERSHQLTVSYVDAGVVVFYFSIFAFLLLGVCRRSVLHDDGGGYINMEAIE